MGESTKGIRIFVIIVLSLFMLAMIYFTASVIKGFKNGALRAENDFMRITETASSAVFFDANSPAVNELANMLSANEYVAAALVASEKNVLFAYPAASPLIGMNIDGSPAVQSSSPMIRIFSTRLAAAPDENTMLTVALYAVRSADIYNPARISFLAILTGLAAVITALIYTSKSIPAAESTKSTGVSYYEKEEKKDTPLIFTEAPAEAERTQTSPAGNDLSNIDEKIMCAGTDFPSENGMAPANRDVTDEVGEQGSHTAESGSDAPLMGDPSGLFSPVTGVGWEQYLETRLDSELMRSASSEQDLALVLLRIPGIEDNRLMMKKIAAILLDFFKFKDFVFEYKNDGFAGVLLNINLDQTMVLAETMYTQFKELLQSENITPKLAIGISMRSLRLLPGSRLIDEADTALNKAFDETAMPIVAFRVNPDKYRQFMADSAGTVKRR